MLKFPVCAAIAVVIGFTGTATAEDAAELAKEGVPAYRLCAACHSLQPGIHLSGPSLADLWGKKAASIESYGRYTEGLKKADIVGVPTRSTPGWRTRKPWCRVRP